MGRGNRLVYGSNALAGGIVPLKTSGPFVHSIPHRFSARTIQISGVFESENAGNKNAP